jgi:hypothetical protein
MFLLMTAYATAPKNANEGSLLFQEMEVVGAYPKLEEAIEAAIKADLDLDSAFIEKSGGRHSVNDWIACHIAGGLCKAG